MPLGTVRFLVHNMVVHELRHFRFSCTQKMHAQALGCLVFVDEGRWLIFLFDKWIALHPQIEIGKP